MGDLDDTSLVKKTIRLRLRFELEWILPPSPPLTKKNNKKQKVILCFIISNCGLMCGLFVGVAVGKGYEILSMPLLKFFLVWLWWRYWSLSAYLGDDDLFSSDLSDAELRTRLGHMSRGWCTFQKRGYMSILSWTRSWLCMGHQLWLNIAVSLHSLIWES